jgi:tRNA threonylcarbamoyladenosine modification (KEOPS) complex Cgi121 subunit
VSVDLVKELRAEYQRAVERCNRITDRDIEEWGLRKLLERLANRRAVLSGGQP